MARAFLRQIFVLVTGLSLFSQFAFGAPTPTLTATPGGLFSVLDHLVVDGTVNSVLKANGALYVGGSFNTSTGARFFVRVDPGTGAYDPGFVPASNGPINDMILTIAGRVVAAGNFTNSRPVWLLFSPTEQPRTLDGIMRASATLSLEGS